MTLLAHVRRTPCQLAKMMAKPHLGVGLRSCSVRMMHGTEFTLAKYRARDNSVGTGYQRGTDFCILTLQHPDIENKVDGDAFRSQMDALYDRRDNPSSPSRLAERVDELFAAYDVDDNGLLDPQELREALSALGLPSDDAPLQKSLKAHGIDTWRGTGNLDKPGFEKLLVDIGDASVLGTVPMYFSDELHTLDAFAARHTSEDDASSSA